MRYDSNLNERKELFQKGEEYLTSINNQLLLLFSQAGTRQEYFDKLVEVIRDWTDCSSIGIRIKDDKGNIPYVSYTGFSPEFLQEENWLCIDHDNCICTRVIAKTAEDIDTPFITTQGSFFSRNTKELVPALSRHSRLFRGTCMKKGYKSLLVIPVTHHDEIIGAIHIADREKDKVPLKVLQLMEKLAPTIGHALYLFKIEKELAQNFEIQKILNEILLVSLDNISMKELMNQALKIILSAAWFNESTTSGQVFLQKDEYEHMSRLVYDFGALSKVLIYEENGTKFVLFAATDDAEVGKIGEPGNGFAVPIQLHGKILGVLRLVLHAYQLKSPLMEQFLTIVANTLAIVFDRKKTELTLKQSRESLARAQHIARLGNWEWDIFKNRIIWSPEAYKIFGLPDGCHLTYAGFLNLVHPEDRELIMAGVNKAMAEAGDYKIDHRIILPDGSERIIRLEAETIYDNLNQLVAIFGTVQDITERKNMEKRLEYLATHDFLTDIPNRFSLEKHLAEALGEAEKGTPGALLFIDLDNFKLINDALGHSVGDELLITLVTMLKNNLRMCDSLFRFGGDEFAVLLKGVNEKQAGETAEHLRKILEIGDLCATGQSFDLTISVGLVMLDGTLTKEEILSFADTALYTAKEAGKNRVFFLKPNNQITENLTATSNLLNLIKNALRENLFILYYQPVINFADCRISHYEVLVRLVKETGEFVFPDVFIPIAENYGLMPQIDKWVVQRSLDFLQQRDVKLFINLSGVSMADDSLLQYIENSIVRSKIAPERIGFEITETSAVRDFTRAKKWISGLNKLGCSFALDDFGIGFSSFSYLMNLPVDYIKIDGSFVQSMDTNMDNRAIVQAINNVAHTLGKKTIAEYVHNKDVMELVHKMGVDCGQGFYLGAPAPFLNGC